MGVNEIIQIGSKIKKIRRKKGIKQKDLAKKINIPVSTLSNYENNYREPDYKTILNIANALKVSIFELMSLETYQNIKWETEENIDLQYYNKLGFLFEQEGGNSNYLIVYYNKEQHCKISYERYDEIKEEIKNIAEYVILKYLDIHGEDISNSEIDDKINDFIDTREIDIDKIDDDDLPF